MSRVKLKANGAYFHGFKPRYQRPGSSSWNLLMFKNA